MSRSRSDYAPEELYVIAIEGTKTAFDKVGPVDYTVYALAESDIHRFADNLRKTERWDTARDFDIVFDGEDIAEIPLYLAGNYTVVTRPDGTFITVLREEP